MAIGRHRRHQLYLHVCRLVADWPAGLAHVAVHRDIGYIASLGLTAWAFFTHHDSLVPAFTYFFIASHAVGQGAVIWVFISEIFPNRHRAEGQTLGCTTGWICAAILATLAPKMFSAFPKHGYVFAFFAFMMVLQLIWVKTMVPETKGVPLEQMQKRLGIG